MDATSPHSDSEDEERLADIKARREASYRAHLREMFWNEIFHVSDGLQAGIDAALKVDRVEIAMSVLDELKSELKEVSDGLL